MAQLKLVYDYLNPNDKERREKLTKDLIKVKECLDDGKVWTVQALAQVTRLPENSVSAHCRHLRKEKYGSWNVPLVKLSKGLSGYQLLDGYWKGKNV